MMDSKGQGAAEYFLLIGGSVVVAIFILWLFSVPIFSQNGHWETNKEWVCDEYRETGELENCTASLGKDEFRTINSSWIISGCNDKLGSEWNLYDWDFAPEGDYDLICVKTEVYEKERFECDKESICVKEHWTEAREFVGGR